MACEGIVMIALLLASFGLAMQAPCVTVDQHDEGWALVILADGTLAELPLPDIEGVSLEGVRVCPMGLFAPPPTKPRSRPIVSADILFEELFR